jgi:small-conductance mechanosensitive channel
MAAWSDEPNGTSVVLQLPPSMSPEAVRSLIADLVAKGAQPAKLPTQAPTAQPAPVLTSADLAARIWDAASGAIQAIPNLLRVSEVWVQKAERDGAATEEASGFWLIAFGGLLFMPLVGSGVRRIFARYWIPVTGTEFLPRLQAAITRFLLALVTLALLGILFWAVLLSVSSGRPIVEEVADRLVWGALEWQFSIAILSIIVSPQRSDLRPIGIDDAVARTTYRWLVVYLTISPLNVFLIWLIERLGFGQETVFGAALAFGFAVTAYKVIMFWAIRRPIQQTILAATAGEPGPCRRAVAAAWHWFFIFLSLAIFFGSAIALSLGRGAVVAASARSTQEIIVVVAVIWLGSHKLVARLFEGGMEDPQPDLRRRRFSRVLHRLCDALLWILGTAWIAQTWGFDLVNPAPGSVGRLFVRPTLLAAATIVGAWILWTAISAVIDEKMPNAIGPDSEDEAADSTSRLGTMLPLVRNMVLIGLVTVALIVALSTLGLDIGPLLAGLGVVGIAIGFGAQGLVRDIISGLFFLMEDAFRVGEYVDTGRLRGTVEGMSLRSVRLRHQNGQVHTIPFGQVQAVTNFSRDWSVVKFNLHLDPAAELETVRKTIKRVGEELLEDADIGADFIQPLKMQGVVDVLQNALVIRCKFAACPVRPTYIQRQALQRLIDAFNDGGIRFASPNVMMQLASTTAG